MENAETTQPKVHEIYDQEKGCLSEGLDLDKANSTGQVVEEITYREDLRRHGTIHTQHSGAVAQVQVTGRRRDGRENTRADKLAEENDSAVAFANYMTQRTGKEYIAERKETEESTFPDVWLHVRGGGERVSVEFAHFDEEAISQLEKVGEYRIDCTVELFAVNIGNAIAKKNEKVARKSLAQKDLSTKTYLVLLSPFPIRPNVYEAISQKVAVLPVAKIFLETCVLPLGQKPFRVQ